MKDPVMLLRKLTDHQWHRIWENIFKTLAGETYFDFPTHGPLGDYMMADKAYGNL